MKKNVLGKGLGAIFAELGDAASRPSFIMCGIEDLMPNRFQPRREFEGAEIQNLVASIQQNGILQPILARRAPSGGYEIIAGERRWRAAQAAGLKDVPVIVREADDMTVAQLSLIENLQREDLNPMEEAEAYHRLATAFHMSQEDISSRVGKDRSTITNALRLLKLPDEAKKALAQKTISAGHARALLAVQSAEDRQRLLNEIIGKNLSVREAENLAKKISHPSRVRNPAPDSVMRNVEEQLLRTLMTKVKIRARKRGGTIEINYTSSDDLTRLVDLLLRIGGRQ